MKEGLGMREERGAQGRARSIGMTEGKNRGQRVEKG